MSKYLSCENAHWMLMKAEKRKYQENKETQFLIGDREWTMDRIQKTIKRSKNNHQQATADGAFYLHHVQVVANTLQTLLLHLLHMQSHIIHQGPSIICLHHAILFLPRQQSGKPSDGHQCQAHRRNLPRFHPYSSFD